MILNRKVMNYKVLDLIEFYNFHIKFIFIQFIIKKLLFLGKMEILHFCWWVTEATSSDSINACYLCRQMVTKAANTVNGCVFALWISLTNSGSKKIVDSYII